jgi:uncharacterized protein YceK
MKKIILIALALVVLSGCGSSPSQHTANWSKGGEYIGQLPDGRKVYCYEVDRNMATHYLYVIDGSGEATVNFKQGKTNVSQMVLPK